MVGCVDNTSSHRHTHVNGKLYVVRGTSELLHSTVCKEQNTWSYRVESVAILRVSKKKNGTKEESKRGHTHQVCHLNHKTYTSDKTLYLTIWSKNGPPKVSYQFKTLSFKFRICWCWRLRSAGTELFSSRNNLQVNLNQCHKAASVGLKKIWNVVMYK